jgi:hypothetical protein
MQSINTITKVISKWEMERTRLRMSRKREKKREEKNKRN